MDFITKFRTFIFSHTSACMYKVQILSVHLLCYECYSGWADLEIFIYILFIIYGIFKTHNLKFKYNIIVITFFLTTGRSKINR